MKRQCRGLNARGGPCGAPPQVGKEWCVTHDTSLPECERFGSPAQAKEAAKLAGRPRNPRPSEVMRDLIERNVAVLIEPYFKTLGYEIVSTEDGMRLVPIPGGGAKMYGESKDGDIVASPFEDIAAMIAASERLLDRVYGKPKQATELTGAGGGPLEIAPVTHDRSADVVNLLALTGGVTALPVANGNGNGHSRN